MKTLKQKALSACIVFLFVASGMSAQSIEPIPLDSIQTELLKPKGGFAYFGLGFGFDYGVIGIKIEYVPIKNLGIFAGVGYLPLPAGEGSSFGWNVGANYRIGSEKKVSFKLMAMYGYNGALSVDNGPYTGHSNTISHGFTPGFGIDIKTGKKENTLSVSLLFPIRSGEFMDTYDRLDNDPDYTIDPLIPVVFSVGYNFKMK